MDEKIYTISLPPYGQQRIEGNTTIALLNGNANYVLVRTGSDAFRLPSGQALPVSEDWAAIVNPFPKAIEICVGQGFPMQFQSESPITAAQAQVMSSFCTVNKAIPAPTTGKKWALGVMMKVGSALLAFRETTASLNSKVMLFPGASKDFMSFKPVGCMDEVLPFRGYNGEIDDQSAYVVSGYYDDAQVAQWITASGYLGTTITNFHHQQFQADALYRASTDVAVFFIREADTGVGLMARMQHLGRSVEDLD